MKLPRTAFHSGKGFSMMEILAIIAILVILAILIFPVFASIRAKVNQAKCAANLKQISIASANYSNDHNGDWPPSQTGTHVFANYIMPYLGKVPSRGASNFMDSPLICPSAKVDASDDNYIHRGIYTPTSWTNPDTGKVESNKYGLSYAQNVYAPGSGDSRGVPKRTSVSLPSQMMLYMEFQGHYISTIARINDDEHKKQLEARHNKHINAAFVDGSVRAITYDDIPKTVAEMPNPFFQGREKN